MEKILIEQLLNSKISFTKIKSIIDNVDKINKQENLNETIVANTNGLRIMTCQGCHKSMFEDKFMLNKTQKRYRSCINCVLRSRKTRQNKGQQPSIDNNIILAICDNEKQDMVECATFTPDINLINWDFKKEKRIKNNDNLKHAKNHESLKFNDDGGLILNFDFNKGLFNLFNS